MIGHQQLFGQHLATGSWLHRRPALAKLMGMSTIVLVAVLARDVAASAGLLLLACALLVTTRVPLRRAFGIPPLFWGLLVLVIAYPVFFGDPRDAVITACTMVGALLMGRVVTLTTPALDLVDALVWLGRPLDWVGIGADRFGLAAMVMLRSVPYLADSFERVGQAHRARGLRRHPLARLTPVVVDGVSYATRTGEALIARGLGDEQPDEVGESPDVGQERDGGQAGVTRLLPHERVDP